MTQNEAFSVDGVTERIQRAMYRTVVSEDKIDATLALPMNYLGKMYPEIHNPVTFLDNLFVSEESINLTLLRKFFVENNQGFGKIVLRFDPQAYVLPTSHLDGFRDDEIISYFLKYLLTLLRMAPAIEGQRALEGSIESELMEDTFKNYMVFFLNLLEERAVK